MITVGESTAAGAIVARLRTRYDVRIGKDWGYVPSPVPPSQLPPFVLTGIVYLGCEWSEGNWRKLAELQWVEEAVGDMSRALGGSADFSARLSRGRALAGLMTWNPRDPTFARRALGTDEAATPARAAKTPIARPLCLDRFIRSDSIAPPRKSWGPQPFDCEPHAGQLPAMRSKPVTASITCIVL